MKEFEIYIIPEMKFWKVGEKGKPATLPSGIEGAGAGDSVGLDEFIEQMKSTIEKAILQDDTVVYKTCSPPWWDPLWESKTQGRPIPTQIEVGEPSYTRDVLTSARTDLQKWTWMKKPDEKKKE